MASPTLDFRDFSQFWQQSLTLARAYCPDWAAYWPADPDNGVEDDPGLVLLKLFSLLAGYTAEMENALPEQRRLAFYQFLNLQTLPPAQARAALAFTLREGQPPKLVPAQTGIVAEPGEHIHFQTDADLMVVPAALNAALTILPAQDRYIDQLTRLAAGVRAPLFPGPGDGELEKSLPHLFIMGDSLLFKPDPALQRVAITLTGSHLHPEFFAQWYDGAGTPLQARVQGRPGRLALDVVLDTFPHAPPVALAGNAEALYWVGVQPGPAVQVVAALSRQLPEITGVVCTFTGDGIAPQQAATGQTLQNVANGCYPFGETPADQDAFYLRSDSVFARTGAMVTMRFDLRPVTADQPVALDWQYHGGGGWQSFNATSADLVRTRFQDTTDCLRRNAPVGPTWIRFQCPAMSPVTVAGEEGMWVRAVIAQGGYGSPPRIQTQGVTATIDAIPDSVLPAAEKAAVSTYLNDVAGVNFSYQVDPGSYDPPYVKSVSLGYSYSAQPAQFLSDNSFTLSRFLYAPYEPVGLRYACFAFGFAPQGFAEHSRGRPLTLYFHLAAESALPAQPLPWLYHDGHDWQSLAVDDGTQGLTRSGVVRFVVPPAMNAAALFGVTAFWFRIDNPHCRQVTVWSITPNSVMAGNRTGIDDEVLGSSNERPNQVFQLANTPVLPGLQLDVVEPRSLEPAGGKAAAEAPLSSIVADAAAGAAGTAEDPAPVVRRWTKVDTFAFSGPAARVYTLDCQNGLVTFGDGRNGMVPPAGHNNIVAAHYEHSQGLDGNVAAGTLTVLKPGIPDIDSVTNPAAALGGVDGYTAQWVGRAGPGLAKANDRAVQLADFAALAAAASPEVWRAAATQADGGGIAIWVLAHSRAPRPYAEPALLDLVTTAVRERCLAVLADRISTAGAGYVPVDVAVDVTARVAADKVNATQADMVQGIAAFLQPVTGGSDGLGWRFGQMVTAADVARYLRADPRVLSINSLALNGHFDGGVPVGGGQVAVAGVVSVVLRRAP